MIKKAAVSETRGCVSPGTGKRNLPDESTASVPVPCDGSLGQTFFFLSAFDLDIIQKERQKPFSGSEGEDIPEPLDDDLQEEIEAEAIASLSDPLSSYLQEINSISLLNRHKEIEIVKRMEEGEKEIAQVIMQSPIMVREVISLGEKLKTNKLSVREVVADIDDEEKDIDDGYYLKKVFSIIKKIDKNQQEFVGLQKQLSQKGIPEIKKRELSRKIVQKRDVLTTLIQQMNLNKTQIGQVVRKLKRAFEHAEQAEREIISCVEEAGIPLEELKRLFRQVKRGRSEERKVVNKTGIAKKKLLGYEEIIKHAHKKIKRIEVESTFDVQSLRRAIKSIEGGR